MKALTVYQPYLAGVLHGDGWCSPLTIGLRCKDEDFAITFATALNALFTRNVVARRDERGYWLVRTGNKRGTFSGLKQYEPADDMERALWLRGLFDSDGNAQCIALPKHGPNSFQRRIAIYSTEKTTLERAGAHLSKLGMAWSIRATKNSASHKGKKTVFELKLKRRESFQAFVEIVGSSLARKRAILERLSTTFQPDGWQAANWRKAVAARYPEKTHVAAIA